MADIVVVAKTNSAAEADIQSVTETAHELAPNAAVVRAASIVTLDDPAAVRGQESARRRRWPHSYARRHGLWGGICRGNPSAGSARLSTRGCLRSATSPTYSAAIPTSARFCRR